MALSFAGGCAVTALAVVAVLLVWRYLTDRAELRRLRELFSRYVPREIADELAARRNLHLLWAKRHYATVLCVRIRNFEFFAEELSAEETLRHLNEFYGVSGRAIARHGGIIERLHGDGITAVFGVLTHDAFQEERALLAALRIVRLANAMNERWQAEGRRRFSVYAGVNSGNVVAGEVGFAARREFAVVGNPANVASRLAQAAQEVNAPILAAASTFDPVREEFIAVALDTLPLEGLRRLHRVYMVRGAVKKKEEPLHLPAIIPTLETALQPPLAVGDYEAPDEYNLSTYQGADRLA